MISTGSTLDRNSDTIVFTDNEYMYVPSWDGHLNKRSLGFAIVILLSFFPYFLPDNLEFVCINIISNSMGGRNSFVSQ